MAIKIGDTFGRLTVVGRVGRDREERTTYWLCRCRCGGEKTVSNRYLNRGTTSSCGCLVGDRLAAPGRRRAKKSWEKMIERCYKPGCRSFSYYGGRGIVVFPKWRKSFAAFYADMGQRPIGTTLGRKDNNAAYAPGNCVWETNRAQANNTSRTIYVHVRGHKEPLAIACRALSVPHDLVYGRLKLGWCEEDAFTVPPRKYAARSRNLEHKKQPL